MNIRINVCVYRLIFTHSPKKSTQSRYRKAATVKKNFFKNAYLIVNGEKMTIRSLIKVTTTCL